MTENQARRLEAVVRALTAPQDGKYPRPWMTSLSRPIGARVFTVGKNPAKDYRVADVGGHEHYLDALFNRGNEGCRALYDRLNPEASPTRKNTDMLVQMLAERGVSDIVETNVVCYSTPMSADLRRAENLMGASVGREIFSAVYQIIQPKVIIAHGAGTVKELSRYFGTELPAPPKAPGPPVSFDIQGLSVFSIPSLAPPYFNTWKAWSKSHLAEIAAAVATSLKLKEI